MATKLLFLDFRRSAESVLRDVRTGLRGNKNGRDKMEEFQLEDRLTSTYVGSFAEFRSRDEFEHEFGSL